MKIRTFEELAKADERTRRFTPHGLATSAMLTPESTADFQQRAIAHVELASAVPEGTRDSFERVRLFHSYGVLCYELFTITDDLTWIVLEQALRERFIDFYGGQIPIVDKKGMTAAFPAADFEILSSAFRWGGSHAKGWQLSLAAGIRVRMPLTLAPLLRWARAVGLLDGQRNARVQLAVYTNLRNHFVHGSGLRRLGMPNQSSMAIRDLTEVINRLWGVMTADGRVYPAPVARHPLVLAWSDAWATRGSGAEYKSLLPQDLPADPVTGWTYLVVLAPDVDQSLREFDARYELTPYPAEYLWGPGTRDQTIGWLKSTQPAGDHVQHLDRLFAIRRDGGKVFLPQRPEVMMSLTGPRRDGVWDLLMADFPLDAFGHVRHLARGEDCPDQKYGGCPVQTVASGGWQEVVAAARKLRPALRPAAYVEAGVPRPDGFAEEVGC